MNGSNWHTKANVLKDLAESTGLYNYEIDDSFLVTGEQPPPPLQCENDDEFNLKFGHLPATDLQQSENPAPDLQGISSMLRMVREYEDHDGPEPYVPKSMKETIVLSKLNPNVPEFMPKDSTSQNHKSKTINSIVDLGDEEQRLNSSAQNDAEEKPKNTKLNLDLRDKEQTSRSLGKNDKKVIVLEKKEYDDIVNNLKSKITCPFRDESFEKKREKNLAIGKLLKLYARTSPIKTNVKPVVLLTPQFFEECKSSETDKSMENIARTNLVGNELSSSRGIVSNNDNTDTHILNVLCTPDNFMKNVTPSDSNSHSNMPSNSLENNLIASSLLTPISNLESEDLSEGTANHNTNLSQEMAQAGIDENKCGNPDPKIISKVNDWLNKKTSEDSGRIDKLRKAHFGPMVYKRKDPATCKSPSVCGKKVAEPTNSDTDSTYKPTKMAEELKKKYAERQKHDITPPPLGIWDKLELELKKKDEEVRNRIKKQEALSSDQVS